MKLNPSAEKALRLLKASGQEAYVVGGCVRDALMGKEAHDWDICTSALPAEVAKIFSEYHVIETGLQHGTLTVVIDKTPLEITSYRSDGEYLDNRRPKAVSFVKSLREDLARRDFTINALAYNHEEGLVDYFGGLADIDSKVIRAVGNPVERFNEDGLRILRALRFASRLEFTIEAKLHQAIHEMKELLHNISVERIYVEFQGILLGTGVEDILMEYRDVIAVFIPEIKEIFDFEQHNPYHRYDVYTHTVKSVAKADSDLVIRLTMFLHDLGKAETHSVDEKGVAHFYRHGEESVRLSRLILNRLKVDNETKKHVLQLIEWHDAQISPAKILRWLNKLGEKQFQRLLRVKRADIMAQSDYRHEERIQALDQLERLLDQTIAEEACFSLRQLCIDGNDLIKMGIPAGRQIGEILQELLDKIIEGQLENKKEKIIAYIKQKYF